MINPYGCFFFFFFFFFFSFFAFGSREVTELNLWVSSEKVWGTLFYTVQYMPSQISSV